MAIMKRALRASSGYGLSVITGGIISLLVIPTVIIVAGSQTWAAIAVAQGVAGFGMVVVGAGWGVTGPTETASMPAGQRSQFYVDSLVSRMWLFIATSVVCVVITLLLIREQPAIALFALIAALVPGLSAGWFFVGEASPMRFLLLETVPRQLGSLLGAVMLFVTGNALWFVGLQLAGGVVATIVSSTSILRRYYGWHVDLSLPRAILRMREHIPAVSMSAVSTLYVNLPIVVVQIFLPSLTAVYALAERIMRLALYATRPYVQVAQGYVPNDDPVIQLRRARRITRLTVFLGILGGSLYAVAAPWIGRLLSGGSLHIDWAMSIWLGLALAAMLISQVTGFAVLTTYRLTKHLAWSTVAGAVVGVVALVPAALVTGVDGVTAVLALSEVVVLLYQLVVIRRTFRTVLPAAAA
jgi:O-antigen/teichoic acid export membrane protein